MKTLYLIGGPMGVGKTAVSCELNRLLQNSVMLDGDWCWMADPFTVTEETKAMVTDNICHLLNGFLRCSAYRNVVFCWVMHDRGIIDGLLSRLELENVRTVCISLTADPSVLEKRLLKDVELSKRTVDVIPKSLAKLPLYEKLGTVLLDTTHLTPRLAAEEIMKL